MIQIPNIIQLNDWEPKKFLRVIVAIQLTMLGAISLDSIDLEIPILRQVIGFLYLTFVPGIVILRLLRLHRSGVAQTVLLATGLSISFLMFSGLFLNSMLSFLKVNSPLSFQNVVIFIAALLILLCILSYKTDKSYKYELPPLKISRSALYLMLLPILSITGTYLVNFHENNILLLILIVLIALIPVLVAFKKIPSELYPLTLVVIAVSLLFHFSLISMYLIGYDIHFEYYLHKLVVNNAYWDSNILRSNVNSMLSIAVMPAIYSYFLNMDGAWIFKIVYPILFSLVPLGLYCIYQHQIKSDKIAFYSAFFFMSFFSFFSEMLNLARQQIAELFFVLLIFLTVQNTLNKNIRNILLLVFGASLVTSHYGVSYIYMFLIIIIYLFSFGFIKSSKIGGSALPEFSLKKSTLNYFLGLYIVFLLLWYMNVSGSSAFTTIVNIGDNIYTSILTDFFNPENRDRNLQMALGISDPLIPSFGRDIHRGLQFLTQLFIIIGFFKLIIDREFAKLKAEYFYLIVACLVILFLSILPDFANKLGMSRIYHIVLIVLSPLFITGGIFVIEEFTKIIKIKNKLKQNYIFLILILSALAPYYLFNTGFVYEMTNDTPTSTPLSMERLKNSNITRVEFYNNYIPEQDAYGAIWYNKYKYADKITYADGGSRTKVLRSYGMTPDYKVYGLFRNYGILSDDRLPRNFYIYLRKLNVCYDAFVVSRTSTVNTSMISPLISKSSKIYSNVCGEVYVR